MGVKTKYLPYIRAWRRRIRIEEREREAVRKKSLQAAREMAKLLASQYGVERVALFGSIPRGESHERSDIDLVVWGLPSHLYFRALAEVSDQTDRPVDLMRFEECRGLIRERIKKEGLFLYEKT